MIKGLVSVIMPAYNAASFIKEAIESVINQTYENWELIIINDGSKDNTLEIIHSFASNSDKIKYIDCQRNRGVAYARNRGISIAKGQFLALLDSDDVWLNEKLKVQVSFLLDKKDSSLVYSSYRRMSSDGKKVSTIIPVAQKTSRKELLMSNNIPLLTVIINRENLSSISFNEKMRTSADYNLWLNILKEAPFAHGINTDLARYRNVRNSLSNRYTKTLPGVIYIHFFLEFENLFLSFKRLFHFITNGISKRIKFPINIKN
ncbi:MAG: glycosyltransferase [Flavobacteriaceae bacterium]